MYDLLKRVVFGKRLDIATASQIHLIKPGSEVLILGGGTGRLLEELPECRISFVEKSKSMIELAMMRRVNNVYFVQDDFLACQLERQFDYIICPFFLDVFDDHQIKKVINRVIKLLKKPSGKLIVIDFEVNTGWQRAFTKVMYWFFLMTTKLQTASLTNISGVLYTCGFKLDQEVIFSKGFIFSRCYHLNRR